MFSVYVLYRTIFFSFSQTGANSFVLPLILNFVSLFSLMWITWEDLIQLTYGDESRTYARIPVKNLLRRKETHSY